MYYFTTKIGYPKKWQNFSGLVLKEDDFFILNEGNKKSEGNKGLISAGTGLGEAMIIFDGKKEIPFACEGGHVDFAPRDEREDHLLWFLRKKFGHVSYERIISGPGLYNIYQFIVETKVEEEKEEILQEIVLGDSPRLISEKGLNGTSQACRKALELFVSIYGSEAGNLDEIKNLIVLGPGNIDQAHKSDEWIALEQLEKGQQVYTDMIRQFCL